MTKLKNAIHLRHLTSATPAIIQNTANPVTLIFSVRNTYYIPHRQLSANNHILHHTTLTLTGKIIKPIYPWRNLSLFFPSSFQIAPKINSISKYSAHESSQYLATQSSFHITSCWSHYIAQIQLIMKLRNFPRLKIDYWNLEFSDSLSELMKSF